MLNLRMKYEGIVYILLLCFPWFYFRSGRLFMDFFFRSLFKIRKVAGFSLYLTMFQLLISLLLRLLFLHLFSSLYRTEVFLVFFVISVFHLLFSYRVTLIP